jgi:hypothetical protein
MRFYIQHIDKEFCMRSKHIILTEIAVLALFIIISFSACSTFGGTPILMPNYVSDGTYTFYPRPQAMQGGVDKTCYLDRITASGGTVTVYIVNTPLAKGSYYGIGGNGWAGSARNSIILQDLDNPSRTWNPTTDGEDKVSGGNYITFEGVTATRFSITNSYEEVPLVFEEIVLGGPDADLNLPSLKNGTYTFFPRLQVLQGGVEKTCYLDRIVVRGGYLTVYLVNTPVGKGSYYGIGGNGWGGSARSSIILQDLDHPQLAYNPTTDGEDSESGGNYITFEGVTAARFSLTNNYENPPLVYEEIILGEPDAQ